MLSKIFKLACAAWALAIILCLILYSPTEEVEEVQISQDPAPVIEEVSLSEEVIIEPTPIIQEEVPEFAEEVKIALAKTVWGEARDCSTTEQAAVIWCILNRVDSSDPCFPDDIISVITQQDQFHGYDPEHPVELEIYILVEDVLNRWATEDVGRVLPKEYLYFHGDGKVNWFRIEYKHTGDYWDWSLESPYLS
jgi:hypothetical protein